MSHASETRVLKIPGGFGAESPQWSLIGTGWGGFQCPVAVRWNPSFVPLVPGKLAPASGQGAALLEERLLNYLQPVYFAASPVVSGKRNFSNFSLLFAVG